MYYRILAIASLIGLVPSIGYGDIITFSNPAAIVIPTLGVANTYPSAINVSGVNGPFGNVTVTLSRVSHTWPDDMGAVVVSPSGTAALLFAGPGWNIRASNLTFVFDENAAAPLPEEGALASGTYKPGLFQWDDDFDAPGPGTNYGLSLLPFRTQDPNGQWRLFVKDSNTDDGGVIAGGWSISFDTDVSAVPEPGSITLAIIALGGITGRRLFRRRR